MADDIQEPEDDIQQQEQDAESSGGGGKGLIIGFVSIVVLLETAMFFFLVPSADQVSALAEAKLIESVQQDETAAEAQATDENKVEEFQFGRVGETFSPIGTERNYRVEIILYGLVRNKNLETMKSEWASKEGRLLNAIRSKIRNSPLEELTENNLGLLERRILTECNHLLENDLLLGIGFQRYELMEQ